MSFLDFFDFHWFPRIPIGNPWFPLISGHHNHHHKTCRAHQNDHRMDKGKHGTQCNSFPLRRMPRWTPCPADAQVNQPPAWQNLGKISAKSQQNLGKISAKYRQNLSQISARSRQNLGKRIFSHCRCRWLPLLANPSYEPDPLRTPGGANYIGVSKSVRFRLC